MVDGKMIKKRTQSKYFHDFLFIVFLFILRKINVKEKS
ncbi:MAG: hypothetical protein IGBAC_1319 [Ignavibacteriae bacterium]|nr:MAG: hypothetical protein IGBAC_1319 [Ignavibacteriota bacterium]